MGNIGSRSWPTLLALALWTGMTARGCFDGDWITFVADTMMRLFPVAAPVFRALRRKRATPTQLMMDTLRDAVPCIKASS